jgi:hypothetical protein
MPKFRDSRETVFQIRVHGVGLSHLWTSQCTFHPGDLNMLLLERIACVFRQNIGHLSLLPWRPDRD